MASIKTNILLLFLLLMCGSVIANDIIITRDEERIDAIIEEVGEQVVKYHRVSNPTGPLFSIATTKISTIIYSNGDVQIFELAEPAPTSQNNQTTAKPASKDANQKSASEEAYWQYKLQQEQKAQEEKARKEKEKQEQLEAEQKEKEERELAKREKQEQERLEKERLEKEKKQQAEEQRLKREQEKKTADSINAIKIEERRNIALQKRQETKAKIDALPLTGTVMANYLYSFDGSSVGVTYAQCKLFGWYANVMIGCEYHFASKDMTDYIYPFDYLYTDKKSHQRFSITGGGMIRMWIPLYAYIGLGYGYYSLTYMREDYTWINIAEDRVGPDLSVFSSANIEVGVIGNIKGFTLSLGYSLLANGIGSTKNEIKLGIGYTFPFKSSKKEL